jgi:hypothetical protein
MMKSKTDAGRIQVWVAMADHFLDTETRHDIPLTALYCVEAGMTVEEARRVWRTEVIPAVGFNLFLVAGEWAGWDRDWLVHEIERAGPRGRFPWCMLPSRLISLPCNHGVMAAIERCMKILMRIEDVSERTRVARDLAALARHVFDFCAKDFEVLPSEQQQRLAALYPEPVSHALAPALVPGEAKAAARRLEAAFAWRRA